MKNVTHVTHITHINDAPMGRKGPVREVVAGGRYITSSMIRLIEDIELRILRDWKRGIALRFIAKDFGLSVYQTEAIIWVRLRIENGLDPKPTDRKSRPAIEFQRAA